MTWDRHSVTANSNRVNNGKNGSTNSSHAHHCIHDILTKTKTSTKKNRDRNTDKNKKDGSSRCGAGAEHVIKRELVAAVVLLDALVQVAAVGFVLAVVVVALGCGVVVAVVVGGVGRPAGDEGCSVDVRSPWLSCRSQWQRCRVLGYVFWHVMREGAGEWGGGET